MSRVTAIQCFLEWTVFSNRLPFSIPRKQFLRALGQHPSDFSPFTLRPWDHHPIVAGCLMPHPSDHRSLGPLCHRYALCASNRATSHGSGMVRHGLGQLVGEIGRSLDETPRTQRPHRGNPRHIRLELYLGIEHRLFCVWAYFSVDLSTSSSVRMRSMVSAAAQIPLENVLRPFFSCTIQCSPAPFTRRVKAASPGRRENPSFWWGEDPPI